jgi:hypothetical protein
MREGREIPIILAFNDVKARSPYTNLHVSDTGSVCLHQQAFNQGKKIIIVVK